MPVVIDTSGEFMNELIYSRNDMAKILHSLFLEIEHGDEEHRKWLRDKILNYISEKLMDKKKNEDIIRRNKPNSSREEGAIREA